MISIYDLQNYQLKTKNNEMNTMNFEKLKDVFKRPLLKENEDANVSKSERILSIAAGAFITFHGVKNIFHHPIIAMGELAAGGLLIQRGITGNCPVKDLAEECQVASTTVIVSEPPHITVV